MKHVLTKEECLILKDDKQFNNTVLVYAFNNLLLRNQIDELLLRNQIMENNKIEKIPAPIFSEFIEAIENKSKKSIYFYCHEKGLPYPKELDEIFKIYINMKENKK